MWAQILEYQNGTYLIQKVRISGKKWLILLHEAKKDLRYTTTIILTNMKLYIYYIYIALDFGLIENNR